MPHRWCCWLGVASWSQHSGLYCWGDRGSFSSNLSSIFTVHFIIFEHHNFKCECFGFLNNLPLCYSIFYHFKVSHFHLLQIFIHAMLRSTSYWFYFQLVFTCITFSSVFVCILASLFLVILCNWLCFCCLLDCFLSTSICFFSIFPPSPPFFLFLLLVALTQNVVPSLQFIHIHLFFSDWQRPLWDSKHIN